MLSFRTIEDAMTDTVAIPLWIVVAAAVLLVLAAVWNVFFPTFRAYFRWRRRRVIEAINAILPVQLPALALMRRATVIDHLANDEKVLEMADGIAKARGEPKAVTMRRARGYARSIVPALSPFFYFRIYYWLARQFIRTVHWVHVGYIHEDTQQFVNDKSCVVMIGNHRSNMDGILIPYVTLHRTMLSFGAGEWSRISIWRSRPACRRASSSRASSAATAGSSSPSSACSTT
jgi:hypothetical protein